MSTGLAWGLLVLAGLFETAWAVGLKYTAGFTRLWPSLATLAAIAVSMGLLGVAAKQLPIGTAYAVWTGVGVCGTAILGIYLFGESVSLVRMLSLAFILCGIIGLKITG